MKCWKVPLADCSSLIRMVVVSFWLELRFRRQTARSNWNILFTGLTEILDNASPAQNARLSAFREHQRMHGVLHLSKRSPLILSSFPYRKFHSRSHLMNLFRWKKGFVSMSISAKPSTNGSG